MEQEIYHKLKQQIQDRCDQEMEALDSISVYLGSFKGADQTIPRPFGSVRIKGPRAAKEEKKTAKSIRPTLDLTPDKKNQAFRLSRPDAEGRIRKVPPLKTDQCKVKDCIHRVHPGNPPCVECSGKACSKHKKGDQCVECFSRPA